MPEGDTVWRTARLLRTTLAGQVLTHTDFRVPRFAVVQLSGRRVQDVLARGKHLLLRVEPDVTVHSHLGLGGTWRVLSGARPVPGRSQGEIRAVLMTSAHRVVGYDLRALDVLSRDAEMSAVGHLGPDLLGPDWDASEAAKRLGADPDRPIGEALLDQRNLAGIGNVYKCELCFLRGVSPWTPVRDAGDLLTWTQLAYRLLLANRHGAVRITASRRPGAAHWVYGRRGCQRCAGPVRRAMQGESLAERVSYWCPHCQRGPGPLSAH